MILAFFVLVFQGGRSFSISNTCERNLCDATAVFCSEQLAGVYRYLGPSCSSGATCTDCARLESGVVQCRCEKVPFTFDAFHGQPCGLNYNCVDGTDCFRPCDAYLFKSQCPPDRCSWSVDLGVCQDYVPKPPLPLWSRIEPGSSNLTKLSESIVNACDVFPIDFSDLELAIAGFGFNDELLTKRVSADTLFGLLDVDMDRALSSDEFKAGLTPVLDQIFSPNKSLPQMRRLVPALTGSDVDQCLDLTSDSSAALVAACASPDLQGDICAADGGKFFCALDNSCIEDCFSSCGWLNTPDPSTSRCIPPSLNACRTNGLFFCSSTPSCVGSCNSGCPNLSAEDKTASMCRSVWWTDQPTDWVCAFRKSADQSCVSDIDCVFGQRACDANKGICVPSAETCGSDRDCGIGFYCPSDPTAGQDPFFQQTCKPQQTEGGDCIKDSDCLGLFRCSGDGKCRGLFSIQEGQLSSKPELCISGQLDATLSHCASPFRGTRSGQACRVDQDCSTTDSSGSLGACKCIGWWDNDAVACKRCQAVTGDLKNNGESLRNWLFAKGTYCHSAWSDDECRNENGAIIASSWNQYMCEVQTLSGGVSLLESDSACTDDLAPIDYCAL